MDKGSPDNQILFALVHLYLKRDGISKAKTYVDAAGRTGADIAHLNDLLARFDDSVRGREAQELYAKAREAAERKDWRVAKDLVSRLFREYAGTDFVKGNKEKIRSLLGKPSRWPRNMKGLAFIWRAGMKPSRKWQKRRVPTFPVIGRGEARLDTDGSMLLADGAFISPAAGNHIFEQCVRRNELTIEAVLKPANLRQSGPARIVSLSVDGSSRNFTLGQQGSSLVLRLRTSISGTDRNGHELSLCRISDEKPFHVIVSYRPGQLLTFLNGEKVLETDRVTGDFEVWTHNHTFILGDEYKVDRDWEGTLWVAAIYGRALDEEEAQGNYEALKAKAFGDED